MKHAMGIIPTLAVATTLAACADSGSPKQAASPALAAHDPSMLGRGSSVVASAVPDYTTVESAGARGSGGALKLESDVAGDIPRFADTLSGASRSLDLRGPTLAPGEASSR